MAILKNKQQGFGLLEVVIAVSVISAALFSLAAVSGIALRLLEENVKNVQVSFLLEEGIEALKVLRDSSWSNNITPLSPGTTYYLNFSNNNWRAVSTNIYIDATFERSFVLQNVNRDVNDDVVLSGGTLDPNTKKITVSVSWFSQTGTTTKNISTYITNLFNN